MLAIYYLGNPEFMRVFGSLWLILIEHPIHPSPLHFLTIELSHRFFLPLCLCLSFKIDVLSYLLFLCYGFYLHVYLCTVFMPHVCRGQKRVLDPQELELQIAMSLHIIAENQTWVLCKTSKCS